MPIPLQHGEFPLYKITVCFDELVTFDQILVFSYHCLNIMDYYFFHIFYLEIISNKNKNFNIFLSNKNFQSVNKLEKNNFCIKYYLSVQTCKKIIDFIPQKMR